ncbi:hypothetical protein [Pseudomonas sp. GM21]|uniref:hypothetical protein n=1 Tax=Pseudomonas sp. GM21 TaxID=1144325 RepID=UPI001EE66ECB|nr:hypothetical protein [Pseudomonas sp. GM21]
MQTLKNFVAADWRSGKDKIYFFFKDTNKYSRFDISSNTVENGFPADITSDSWGAVHAQLKNLRFGFTAPHSVAQGVGAMTFYGCFITPLANQWSANTIRTLTSQLPTTFLKTRYGTH